MVVLPLNTVLKKNEKPEEKGKSLAGVLATVTATESVCRHATSVKPPKTYTGVSWVLWKRDEAVSYVPTILESLVRITLLPLVQGEFRPVSPSPLSRVTSVTST